jgi:hypothetical protein
MREIRRLHDSGHVEGKSPRAGVLSGLDLSECSCPSQKLLAPLAGTKQNTDHHTEKKGRAFSVLKQTCGNK